jgi:hypothetical protein
LIVTNIDPRVRGVQMRFLVALLILMSYPLVNQAAKQDCGNVAIVKVLAGPRHGSMIQVSNTDCGLRGGWVCLDPDGQFMSVEESRRLYSFVLAMYMADKPVRLTLETDGYPAACGGYPVVEDARTP